jgi:hypothetical protein
MNEASANRVLGTMPPTESEYQRDVAALHTTSAHRWSLHIGNCVQGLEEGGEVDGVCQVTKRPPRTVLSFDVYSYHVRSRRNMVRCWTRSSNIAAGVSHRC